MVVETQLVEKCLLSGIFDTKGGLKQNIFSCYKAHNIKLQHFYKTRALSKNKKAMAKPQIEKLWNYYYTLNLNIFLYS